MSHRRWGTPVQYVLRGFHERAYLRASLPMWDARWQSLTAAARAGFLDEVKIPADEERHTAMAPVGAELGRFVPSVLKELTDAGFVDLRPDLGRPAANRVFAVAGVRDFALRVRTLKRLHLLDHGQPGAVQDYIENNYFIRDLMPVVMRLLQEVGIVEYVRLDDAIDRYILTYRWVNWVVSALGDRLLAPLVDLVLKAGGPVCPADLIGKLDGADPPRVNAAVDQLIAHLVLFEDLDPATLELRVGLFPSVREQLIQARRPRQRPPLVACETLKDEGPDEGFRVSDLRAVLLEVARAPARLRQDHSLFQKEMERFENVLESLPSWFSKALNLSLPGRLLDSFQLAINLKLVTEVVTGKALHRALSSRGQEWLIDEMDDQFLEVVAYFRAPRSSPTLTSSAHDFSVDFEPQEPWSHSDQRFLGPNVVSLKIRNRNRTPYLWDCKQEEFEPLRLALDAVFSALPLRGYHRSGSIIEHAIFGAHNPLLLGQLADPNQLAVYRDGRLIPPLDDRLEQTARDLLLGFIAMRLVPLGCLRMGIDEQGTIVVAREPRLGAYFGHELVRDRPAGAWAQESKVVVQPDYSVVIIGPSHGPAAELLPFCERTGPASGRGALVLKITRESVLQALARGLAPAEVMLRLKRHATHDLPANVAREVEGWTSWVRHVAVERLTVLRCPDRETADRVMGALHKHAERVHETIVAIPPDSLTPVEHQKLLGQGIIVDGTSAAERAGPKPKAKAKAKTRQKRRRYD